MLFFANDLKIKDVVQSLIKERRSLRGIVFPGALHFITGDILMVVFWVRNYIYKFEGICICLRKKNFKVVDVVLILRNVIMGVGIELIISYYLNRVFFLNVLDYKRKMNIYNRSKLYYIRNKVNRNSRIK